MAYDERHGGPYDRGSADAWYGRPYNPHYYLGASYQGPRIGESEMTPEEVREYAAGYRGQTGRKDWGQWDDVYTEPEE